MADWEVYGEAELSPAPDAMKPPRPDAIEVVMTLSVSEYEEVGEHLAKARKLLDLPLSASNTDVIIESLRRAAERPPAPCDPSSGRSR